MQASLFEIVDRKEGSLKYQRAQQLTDSSSQYQQIVVSTADMEFKFPKPLYDKMFDIHPEPFNLGYPNARPSLLQTIQKWINKRYCDNVEISLDNTTVWSGIGPVIAGSINYLTEIGDQVLVLTPAYYRYIEDTKLFNRIPVQFPLQIKDNRYFIDFQKLEQMMTNHNIKLLLMANPWNPCGRIWSKDELTKLKDLLIKYQIRVLADEIFSDSIHPEQETKTVKDLYTSFLTFPDLYPYLVYASSANKAFNTSGMPFAITISFDETIFKSMFNAMLCGGMPSYLSYNLLELLYTEQQADRWRKDAILYIRQNYNTFKSMCGESLPKLKILDLQCSYLMVVDFKEYTNINFSKFKEYFKKVNVLPVFMSQCQTNQQQNSSVRINIACNRNIIIQIVKRLEILIQLPQIQ